MRAQDALEEHYRKLGVPIKEPESLTRVIYFDKDSDMLVVQSGGPNVSDGAIIHTDGRVELLEVKKLHEGGAQLKSHTLKVDAGGYVDRKDLDKYPIGIATELSRAKVKDAYGTNFKLKVTEEDAMEYFVAEYQNSGVDKFLYTSREGHTVIENLKGDPKEISNRLLAKGLRAEVVLRANYGKVALTPEAYDKLSFDMGTFFDMGKTFEPIKGYAGHGTGYFNFGELKQTTIDNMKPAGSGPNALTRMGEYILPIKYNELSKIKPDTKIPMENVEMFPLTLTGTIKYFNGPQ